LFTGSDTIDHVLYPNKDYQVEWLCMYLEEVASLKGVVYCSAYISMYVLWGVIFEEF